MVGYYNGYLVVFSYGIALYCQMRNLAKTQIRIYKMSLKFLGDIFVVIW